VVDHIDRHLDGDLALDVLSGVVAFSPNHFHRQFSAMFCMSFHHYVQMVRIKRAASRLVYCADTVTDIAFDFGYEAPDSFARAFRQRIGQPFRNNQTGWPRRAAMEPLFKGGHGLPKWPQRHRSLCVTGRRHRAVRKILSSVPRHDAVSIWGK
jgi:AraC family transcriptional regulator